MTNYTFPRHRHLANKITKLKIDGNVTNTYLNGLSLGNSITAGAGTTASDNPYTYQLAKLLVGEYGYGVANDWAASNYGVSGATIANVIGYIAHIGDDTLPQKSESTTNLDYALVMSLRNDVTTLSVGDYSQILRTTFRQLLSQNIDVIFITEFPKINPTTGEVLDNVVTWNSWYEAAIRICGEEGVSLVDNWKYWIDSKVDLRNYTVDGVHYGDLPHAQCASLIFSCLSKPVDSSVVYSNDSDGRGVLVGKYIDKDSTSLDVISSLTTASIGRKAVLNEVDANCFTTAANSTLTFNCPVQTQGLILTMIGGGSNTGTATIQLNGVNIVNGSGMSGGTLVREVSHYRPLNSSDANSQYIFGQEVSCDITAVGGQIQVSGVLFLGSTRTQYNSPETNVIESGSWSGSTLSSGGNSRQSSTVGNTATIRFFGTGYHFNYTRGTDKGKFTYEVDGTGSTLVDCYLNASPAISTLDISNLTRDWHTLVITIATKNGSSSANTVGFGETRTHDYTINTNTQYTTVSTGNTINLPNYWERAVIHEIISGTPLNPDFTPGDSTFTLRGSGIAVIRLER